MPHEVNFVAADLGASSGKIFAGCWNGRRFTLEELHRFENGPVRLDGSLYWDARRIWREIQQGLASYRNRYSTAPAGISVDAWGVDFALLDKAGQLCALPHSYRDSRTEGIPELVFQKLSPWTVFQKTGTLTSRINTLFQLYSMVLTADPALKKADALLMIPDIFHYWLCGEKAVEYSEATTTQMLAHENGDWARDMLGEIDIPLSILRPVIRPGTIVSKVRSSFLDEIGISDSFPVIAGASHDTASAVAAIPEMDESSVFISSGTWSLMGVEVSSPIISEQAFEMNFTNEGGADNRMLFLRNITGLWLLQECIRQWNEASVSHSWGHLMQRGTEAAPFHAVVNPDADRFLMPRNMAEAIQQYCRTTQQPIPDSTGAIVRCCLESLALKYRWVLEALEQLTGRHLQTIRIVGGGCLNTLLCQLTADACNLPVVCGPVEASAIGNIMQQAVATGHLQSISAGRGALAASIARVTYAPHHTPEWDEIYQRFLRLNEIDEAPSPSRHASLQSER